MPEALRAVNWLFERGFLLDRPGPSEHRVEDPHPEAGPPPRSLEFWIHITNNCNLACQYCFVAGKNLQEDAATASSSRPSNESVTRHANITWRR